MIFNIDISYFIAILTGILSSTHCIGMCGGVVIFLSISSNNNKNFYYIYNFGRIISYFTIGIVSGIIGILINDFFNKILLFLKLISNLAIINIGIYIIYNSKTLLFLEKLGFIAWNKIYKYINLFFPIKNVLQAIIIGFIWGFIPCGIVYNVLIWTINCGSIIKSSFLMLLFGIGTLPAMLLTGHSAILYKKAINNKLIKKILGFLLIFLGVIGIYFIIFPKCH